MAVSKCLVLNRRKGRKRCHGPRLLSTAVFSTLLAQSDVAVTVYGTAKAWRKKPVRNAG